MNKNFKRTMTILLISLMFLTSNIYAATGNMNHFEKSVTYVADQFDDVDENQWYGANKQESVMLAYELGLMKGNKGLFSPNGKVTLVEAITMAARVAAIYNDEEALLVQGQPWYKVYVDYCIGKRIIEFNDFFDYNQPATRAQMAYIFAKALPETEFKKINQVEILPDVSEQSTYGKEIFLLYNSGVVGGSDKSGAFKPNSTISRAEAATIISREVLLDKRLTNLLFLNTSANQESQVIEEEVDTASPDYLWNRYFSPGIKVDTNDQLDWVLYYATSNRIPNVHVNLAPQVFNILGNYMPDGLGGETHDNLDANAFEYLYYPGAYYDTTITFNYNVYGEVKALMQSDMAWTYASDDAKERYDYLYDLLDEIGTAGESPRDKVTLIHDYMVKNYQYDETYTKYSFTNLIDFNSAVCQGYAQMFYLLANMSGVETQYLSGMAGTVGDSELHAWNRVIIDGYWYYVDTTWDDPIPDGGANASIVTDYLLITRAQMDKDHNLEQIDGKAVGK